MSTTGDRKGRRRNRRTRAALHEVPRWPSALLIFVACAIVFGHTVLNQFVDWDDNLLIVTNPHLNPPTVSSLRYLWLHPYAEVYNPLVYSLYALQIALFGMQPLSIHVVNLLLHTASALLLWRCFAMLLPKSRWAAVFGALVFVVHPLQAEAVSWATGQKEVLSGFFCIAALYMYLRARPVTASTDDQEKTRRHNYVHWYAGGLLCFVMALFANPQLRCGLWRYWLWKCSIYARSLDLR